MLLCVLDVLNSILFFLQDAFSVFVEFLEEVQGIDSFTKYAWEKTLVVMSRMMAANIKKLDEGDLQG